MVKHCISRLHNPSRDEVRASNGEKAGKEYILAARQSVRKIHKKIKNVNNRIAGFIIHEAWVC